MKHREIIHIAQFAPWNESTNTGVFVWLRETDNSKRNTKKKQKRKKEKKLIIQANKRTSVCSDLDTASL